MLRRLLTFISLKLLITLIYLVLYHYICSVFEAPDQLEDCVDKLVRLLRLVQTQL